VTVSVFVFPIHEGTVRYFHFRSTKDGKVPPLRSSLISLQLRIIHFISAPFLPLTSHPIHASDLSTSAEWRRHTKSIQAGTSYWN